ncbi:MAG: RpiB/LacA/LacB family sugar-phosphate isomerase [Patescibacteria group bacterium]|nr:RpiB/LacA/LacB family sugar-phosphate isomerase [Patescibacteria group bacterium]MDD5490930.1 RpiB/LacA/LacB family sugar-phosphate isomerase [Patescibacteria group bacterium]
MIYLGADHAGFDLKKIIKNYLDSIGVANKDLGNTKLDPDDDYNDFAKKVAQKVAREKGARGILICGTGNGVCIVANKIRGIQAAIAHNEFTARMAKRHGDTNILCLGGRVVKPTKAKKLVKIWLEEKLSPDPKYLRRIKKIFALEKNL